MNLEQLCKTICHQPNNQLPPSHPIGSRILCPEYSPMIKEIKTYPFPNKHQIFALCWILSSDHMLQATLVPSTPNFTYLCPLPTNHRTQLHTHDYLELSYIVSGQFQQNILGKTITFHQGDLCLIDKNCFHQDLLENTPATILFLGITNSMFNTIMDNQVASERIVSFLKSALLQKKDLQQYLHFKPKEYVAPIIEPVLFQLLSELIHFDEASPYICQGLLMRIFHILSVHYDFSLSKELKKEMNWILFQEITHYIKSNYTSITIQQLVDKFHFQADYFNRLIKAQTNMTYTEYVQELRLKRAEDLLLHTSLSIDEISEQIGYHNKGYFYKIFMKRYQMTPAQFRKKRLHI